MFRVKTSHIKLQIPLYFFVTYDVNASRVFSLVSYLFTKHCLRTQRFSRNPLYSKKRQHAGASSVCARSLNTQTLLTCWSGSVREAEIQEKKKKKKKKKIPYISHFADALLLRLPPPFIPQYHFARFPFQFLLLQSPLVHIAYSEFHYGLVNIT